MDNIVLLLQIQRKIYFRPAILCFCLFDFISMIHEFLFIRIFLVLLIKINKTLYCIRYNN